MRIYGPNGTTLGSPASHTRRTSSTGFSLPETPAAPEELRSAAAPKAAGNIDALLALQGVEDPTERRKRSVARGRGALDVLDELKIGLLSGNLDASTVNRLRDAAANLKSSSGDPGLDSVLSEIELRVFGAGDAPVTGVFALPNGELHRLELRPGAAGYALAMDPLRGRVHWRITR